MVRSLTKRGWGDHVASLSKTVTSVMCVSIAFANSPSSPVSESDAAVIGRAKEFAHAINAGKPKDFKRLVDNAFGSEFQRIPLESQIALLASIWDLTRGIDYVALDSSQPYEGVVTFRNRLTQGKNHVFFRVEPEGSHRFIAVRALDEIHIQSPPTEKRKQTRIESPETVSREMRSFMGRLAKAEVFSGAVEVAEAGKPVFQGAYGFANRDNSTQNTVETKFVVGSIGKVFTAVAIAQLAERGQLSYEDPVSKFFPNFPSANQIKIKHLLSHTSGLAMWWTARSAPPSTQARGRVDEMFSTISGDEGLSFPPGTQYLYSNTGYLVLGKVIEVASGQSYSDFVRQNVFAPAGMANTFFDWLPDVATRYEKSFDAQGNATFSVKSPPPGVYPTPFGGAVSTVGDLMRFDSALRSGKLLNAEDVQVLLTPKPELGAARYGYGFDVDDHLNIAGHGGGAPGVSGNLDMFLGSKWSAVVLSNCTEASFETSAPVVEEIRQLVGLSR